MGCHRPSDMKQRHKQNLERTKEFIFEDMGFILQPPSQGSRILARTIDRLPGPAKIKMSYCVPRLSVYRDAVLHRHFEHVR